MCLSSRRTSFRTRRTGIDGVSRTWFGRIRGDAKQNSDKQNARIEHDKALRRVMTALLQDDTELFKQFQRQRVVPAVADGHDLLDHLRGRVGSSSFRTGSRGRARVPAQALPDPD